MAAAAEQEFAALLDDGERAALRSRARPVQYPAGARILHQGEPGDKVLLIERGRGKVTYVTGAGRELVLRFCGPGELVGELAVLDGGPRLSSIVALESLEALVVAAGDFRALLHAEPGIAWRLLVMLSTRFRDADLKRVEFGASDTVGRVAARLVELAERYGEPRGEGVHIDLPLSQDELGGWTGASPAGVAAALRTLRELGWIETGRRHIVVLDSDALRGRSTLQN
jgi:CRP/FNR family transcriptional regulator, cyclic AMP receptor protein